MMHTSPESGSVTLTATGCYEKPDQNPNRNRELAYQCLTLAAMLLVLATLWVF
jgi:hypothetical protein